MLPPSTTGWIGSAARIAAISDDVVVLPFVPVTPIVGAGQSRRNRSASRDQRPARAGSPRDERSRSAARSRGSVVGKSGLIEGDVATSAAPAHAAAGSTSGPATSRTGRPSSAVDRVGQLGRPAGRRRP